ncbi:hypothetical protein ABK040_006475 [Willaertia magna]
MFESSSAVEEEGTLIQPPYELTIQVVEARNLPPGSDAYCKLFINSPNCKSESTKIKKSSANENPVWNQSFMYRPLFRNCPMIITVWNQNLITKSDFLGCIKLIPLRITKEKETIDQWFTLEELNTPKYRNIKINDKREIRLRINWTRLIEKGKIAHFQFEDPFDKYTNRIVKDSSGHSNHLRFKNLNTSDVEGQKGVKETSQAASFSGFNYLESSTNPLSGKTEFSISFWFKCDDPDKDFIMLNTLTADNTLISQEYRPYNYNDKYLALQKLYGDKQNSDPLLLTVGTSVNSPTPNNNNSPFDSSLDQNSSTTPTSGHVRKKSGSFLSMRESFNNLKVPSILSGKSKKDEIVSIEHSGFSIGTREFLFYDCYGNLIASKKKKDSSQVDYEDIFNDLLSKISDDEDEYYTTNDNEENSLTLKVFDDTDGNDDESFPKTQLYKLDDWNHVAYVYSGDRLREYINGVLIDDLKGDFRLVGNGLNKIQVGSMNDGYRYTGFKGCLDELMIFNYALSTKEVLNLNNWKDAK